MRIKLSGSFATPDYEKLISDLEKSIDEHLKNNDGSLQWVDDLRSMIIEKDHFESML